jgi:hypothetical protein
MVDFKRNVEHYIRVHKNLHGNSYSELAVAEDLFNSFKYNRNRSLEEIKNQTNIEYGLFLGRCQPFTNGHNETIQDIIRDGKIPIIILGSINKLDEKNPLSFEVRKHLIRLIYGNSVIIVGAEDKPDWTEWYQGIKDIIVGLGITKAQITLYSHSKPEDKLDFEYNGKKYENEWYTQIFRDNGVAVKNLDEVVCSLGETIHASDVRRCENIAIRNLDARIYIELKNVHKWWSI